jgi:hypothetical protein
MASHVAVFIAGLAFALSLAGLATAGDAGQPLPIALTGANEVRARAIRTPPVRPITVSTRGRSGSASTSAGPMSMKCPRAPSRLRQRESSGPIAEPLLIGSFGGTDATSGWVRGVEPDPIKAIRKHPSAYYVNVHSTESP